MEELEVIYEEETPANYAKVYSANYEKIRSIVSNITCIFSDDDYFVSLEQEKEFKDKFLLLSKEEILEKELFGNAGGR